MICPHWEYLITLDSDLLEVSRYVHICAKNNDTYSIEFVRLLLAVGSEIDVVAKLLCGKIDSSRAYRNIDDYQNTILLKYPKFHTMIIDIPRHELELVPWDSWKNNQSPTWWTAYNNVKHQRDIHYQDANLFNTINAVAGLYSMIWYLLKVDPGRKRWGNTVLFSVNRYIIENSVHWATSLKDTIPDEK